MHITLASIGSPEPRRERLLCPVCQCHHIEPIALSCSSLGGHPGETTIDAEGLYVDPAEPPTEGGSVITLIWRCQEGHGFGTRLRTIHGITTIETMVMPFAITRRDPDRN